LQAAKLTYRLDIYRPGCRVPVPPAFKTNKSAIMDIKTLCLGLLCKEDASGYDLKKQFETNFKHFYPAGFGSIYPSLADLAAKQLVECREIPQDKKPDRKVYSITDAGRQTFIKALADVDTQYKLRSECLVVAYFSDFLEHEALRSMLSDWQEQLGESVSQFDRLSENNADEMSPRKQFVVGFGKAVSQAMSDYISANRELLVSGNKAGALASIESKHVDNTINNENRL